jgi:hypothetical protein
MDGDVGGLAQSTLQVARKTMRRAKEVFTANRDITDEQGPARTEKEKENMGNAGSRLP